MKKIYFIFASLITTLSFGQILSDDFNYTDGALLSANGWTAFSGAGTQAVDVGTSNGLTYAGYSGTGGFTGVVTGNAARLDNTGEDVNRTFTAVTSGSLYYSFLINVGQGDTGYFAGLNTTGTTFGNRIFVRPSTTVGKINFGISNTATAVYGTTDFDPNTTYLIIVKYDVSTTGATSLWVKSSGVPATEAAAGAAEVSNSGSGSATIGGLFLRQYSATQNITIDGIRMYATWFNTTPCSLALGTEITACDAVTSAIDTYTATIPFTGGNTAAYTLSASAGTISGDNPSTTAAGNIIISGIPEGTNVTLTVSGGCSFNKAMTSPECKIVNPLPLNEPFNYTAGNSLGAQQMWTNVNTGDNIVVATGNLSYPGITSSGNSITFVGTGIDARTPFTSTNSGTIYASFLATASDYANVTTDLTSTYFAAFTEASGSTTTAGRIWIRKNGTQYQYGLSPNTSAPTIWSSNLYNVNDTQYLVLGYDFTTNLLSLYENPTIGGSASSTASVTPAVAFPTIGGFLLRQDAANNTPTMIIDELTVTTTPTFTLGSASFSQIEGLRMYPNPTKNNLYIETALNGAINVSIVNMLGKEVVNTNVVNNSVNVANLTSGIYIVKITEEGKTSTKKLIIE